MPVAAHELGVRGVSFVPAAAHPVNHDRTVVAPNPLGKIPTLITDEGTVLYDSRVICEYLNATGKGSLIHPPAPRAGACWWRRSLADGIMDAAVSRAETVLRPEPFTLERWIPASSKSDIWARQDRQRVAGSASAWFGDPAGCAPAISTRYARRSRGARTRRPRRGSSDSARGLRWWRLGRRRNAIE